jgi:dihydrofolate reductase
MTITIIAAMTKDRVIADSNKEGMLWHIPEELKYFRQQTLGKTCVVGRKTAQQMPILDGRNVLVLSRTEFELPAENYYPAQFYPENMRDNLSHEFMIIGGAEIYNLFIPYANKVILSIVDIDAIGNKLFPELDCSWQPVSVERHDRFSVFTYTRQL